MSSFPLVIWLGPALFYLIGSIPNGYLVGRLRGIDIREHGSGNIGATNVWRVLGRTWGMLAFICDFLKGYLPLMLLRQIVLPVVLSPAETLLLVACGVAVVLGHNYTLFLNFRGGKGIATSAGVLGALMPTVLLLVFSVWLLTVLLTRLVSLGSVLAALCLPPATWTFHPRNWIFLTLAAIACVLAVWRHRANLGRLRAGTEPKIGARPSVLAKSASS